MCAVEKEAMGSGLTQTHGGAHKALPSGSPGT